MAGSLPSTLGVDPTLSRPPSTQIVPSATVVADCWRAIGASFTGRHAGAHCVLRGAICRASDTDVDSACVGLVPPPTAYTVSPTAPTAIPCRGVRSGGSDDHVPATT